MRCFLPTTVIGIPIGAPSQSPEPKSAWTLPFAPIERTISSEFAATGSVSTRWFHGLDFGNTGQRGADGIFNALAVEPPRTSVPRHRTGPHASCVGYRQAEPFGQGIGLPPKEWKLAVQRHPAAGVREDGVHSPAGHLCVHASCVSAFAVA